MHSFIISIPLGTNIIKVLDIIKESYSECPPLKSSISSDRITYVCSETPVALCQLRLSLKWWQKLW